MSFEYIDQSIVAMETLDVATISQIELMASVGFGGQCGFYPLEGITAADNIAVGLKAPRSPSELNSIGLRLQKELPLINTLTEAIPELHPLVPQFMGQIAIEGQSDPVAFITEDATCGGSKRIFLTSLSQAVRARLASVFCSEGQDLYAVFDDEVLDNSMAFIVGEEERLLDFTPAPFKWSHPLYFGAEKDREYMEENLNKLTLYLPVDSLLAQQLSCS